MPHTLQCWQGNFFLCSFSSLYLTNCCAGVVATARCSKESFFGEHHLNCLPGLCWLLISCPGVLARPTVNSTWLFLGTASYHAGGMMRLLCGNSHSNPNRNPAILPLYSGQGESSKQSLPFEPFSIPSLLASPPQKQQKLGGGGKAFPCMFLMRPKLPSEEDKLPICPGCPYLLSLHYIYFIFSHLNRTLPLTVMLRKTSTLRWFPLSAQSGLQWWEREGSWSWRWYHYLEAPQQSMLSTGKARRERCSKPFSV